MRSLLERGEQEAAVLDRDPEGQAELYATLGTIHQHLGDYDRADSLLTRSLATPSTRAGGPNSRSTSARVHCPSTIRENSASVSTARRTK